MCLHRHAHRQYVEPPIITKGEPRHRLSGCPAFHNQCVGPLTSHSV